MRVLITRPSQDAEAFAERLHGHGIESLIEPMLTIHHLPGAGLNLAEVQALLVTSANGVRALAAADDERASPLLAVGDATAAAARGEGFTDVTSADGDVDDLVKLVQDRLDTSAGALVHAGGSAVTGDLVGQLGAAGFEIRRAVIYEARASAGLSPACQRALAEGSLDGAVFFSPRSASTFVRLLSMADSADRAAALQAFCLSDAVVAAAAEISWRGVHVSGRPDVETMIDLLVREATR
jgi:uroporphyrinogen-III synthase